MDVLQPQGCLRHVGAWSWQIVNHQMSGVPPRRTTINLRGISSMNKTELIEHISSKTDLSKADVGRALEAFVGAVKTTLKKKGSVTLVGFGTFAVSDRAARTGRNPRTGEAIKIKKARVPKFRPGKALKDAVN
jgi:DNA-binding protein HU-beta